MAASLFDAYEDYKRLREREAAEREAVERAVLEAGEHGVRRPSDDRPQAHAPESPSDIAQYQA